MTRAMPSAAEDAAPRLSGREFDQIRRLLYDCAGLDLRPGKEVLVSARLSKYMRQLKMSSFEEFYRWAREDASGQGLATLINALTTNYTSFLREPAHFEFLVKRVLEPLAPGRMLRIWSAACATGEEPYSIAFCAFGALGPSAGARVRILATDISTKALDVAVRGLYSLERVASLPEHWRRQYLLRGEGDWRGWCRVRPEVQATIEFRHFNLIGAWPKQERFDVVFCRNVMIYFDRKTQESVVEALTQVLEPGGFLLIGHAESLGEIRHTLDYVAPAVYRKPVRGGSR